MFASAIEKLNYLTILNRIQRYCRSEPGKQLVRNCLPSVSLIEIRRNHKLLGEMKRVLESDDPVPLGEFHDIRPDLHRSAVEGTVLTGKQLLYIGSALHTSGELLGYITKRSSAYPGLDDLAGGLIKDKVLEHHISGIINDEGEIKDSASDELRSIRNSIRTVSETLRRRLEKILKSLASEGMAQEELITARDGRMVLPVKVEYKQRIPGFIHSSSASGATVFIEPAETLEINNELREFQIAEQREIHRILKSITEKIAEQKEALLLASDTLAEFDFIYAKAQYSIEIIGTTPRENDKGEIKLIGVRHPVLLIHHKRETVVPLSVALGGERNTLLITGPNAGGKSVAMQAVGLMTLMYQAGIHIPASDESELPVFKKIFVSMGDEQSVEQDLSTFSSHLISLKKIIGEADDSSLVLIDEIGAGTDPVEGSAIAASILRYLTGIRASTVATTHHGDLKAFAYSEPGVENGAMEFDQETLSPTYRFSPGTPGSSYALEIAQRLGFPEPLISGAREFLGSEKSKIEELLIELEQQSQKYKKELDVISSEKSALERMTAEYREKMKTLNAEIKSIKQKAAGEAKTIVTRANAIIEQAVKEIRETSADPAVAGHWREQVKSFKAELKKTIPEEEKNEKLTSGAIPARGDRVVMEGSKREGEILSDADSEGYMQVVFGSVKMRVRADKLQKINTTERPVYQRAGSAADIGDTITPRSIDVRGYTGDEAIPAVDQFLDRAILAGFKEVEIIHGKGTGMLRKHINEFLKKHSAVKLARLGNWNEGGTGVTVVELKGE